MKSYAIILLLCGATFALGVAVGKKQTSAAPAPSVIKPEEISSVDQTRILEKHPQVTSPQSEPGATPLAAKEPSPEPAPEAAPAVNARAESTQFSAAITHALSVLLSPQSTYQEKQAVWKELRDSGQLDQAIEALKQGAAQNPTSPQYQVTLGQAQLQKAGVLSRSGASMNEMGIAGMQADQSFDAALKIDPSNWDAQFYKAVAMSHWPAELNKGNEVVQMLSRLIDQQDTQSPQPRFAQTYTILGDQYLKMGQPDYAQQTWRLGLQKFPTDATLLKKLSGK